MYTDHYQTLDPIWSLATCMNQSTRFRCQKKKERKTRFKACVRPGQQRAGVTDIFCAGLMQLSCWLCAREQSSCQQASNLPEFKRNLRVRRKSCAGRVRITFLLRLLSSTIKLHSQESIQSLKSKHPVECEQICLDELNLSAKIQHLLALVSLLIFFALAKIQLTLLTLDPTSHSLIQVRVVTS